ncbi:MAG: hypothetical protein RMM98_15290 [Acidobacteriota bacterium]|nr:hypothetical protein [Blastocatellia bacterium]MDW8240967.1 hypothetical protein [Acidobacteriota bacterium]
MNLASTRFRAEVSTRDNVILNWPHSVMLNRIVIDRHSSTPVAPSLSVQEELSRWTPPEWWDGQAWRPIKKFSVERLGRKLAYKFTPLSTTGVRVRVGNAHGVEVYLDDEAKTYFQRVYGSPEDELFKRLLGEEDEPSFETTASLLLPLNFHKTAIGRKGDEVETIVLWNGTLVMVENQDKAGWIHGTSARGIGSGQGVDLLIDRWFALACGPDGELFGSRPAAIHKEYVNGYLPGVITSYRKGGLQFIARAFVTIPDDDAYGTMVQIEVINDHRRQVMSEVSVILGRRMSARNGTRRHGDVPAHPLNFDPMETGYSFDPATNTVRNAQGHIVLYTDRSGQWKGTRWENVLSFPLQVAAKGRIKFHLFLPSVTAPERDSRKLIGMNFDRSFAKFTAYWESELAKGMKLHLPEGRLNQLYKNLLAQALIILLDGEKLKYGAYWYEDYFGIEEGWPLVALAQYGFQEESKRYAEIMLSADLMDKSNYHHQYRNGLAPWYALEVFRFSGDRQWLWKITPQLKESAEWTMRARRENEGRNELTTGLLPKHAYGGDIRTPAYSIYSNATCWRGLQETGLVFQEVGMEELAKKYLDDAAEYRATILAVCDRILDRSIHPPFLPMALEIGDANKPGYKARETSYPFLLEDDLGNYWSLFAPLFLETGIFPSGEERARWITDYLEQRGGVMNGLARFYRGLDHIYGFGYALTLLEAQQREKFLAAFYGMLAHGMSRDTFSSPEVAGVFPLRVSNLFLENTYLDKQWRWGIYGGSYLHADAATTASEPLSAGAGIVLQLLRKMLISEERDQDQKPTGRLILAPLIPRRWLDEGKRIEVRDAPTYFGSVSFSIHSQVERDHIAVEVIPPQRSAAAEIVIRLPHPGRTAIRRVEVNGREWTKFSQDEVFLPGTGDRLKVEVFY